MGEGKETGQKIRRINGFSLLNFPLSSFFAESLVSTRGFTTRKRESVPRDLSNDRQKGEKERKENDSSPKNMIMTCSLKTAILPLFRVSGHSRVSNWRAHAEYRLVKKRKAEEKSESGLPPSRRISMTITGATASFIDPFQGEVRLHSVKRVHNFALTNGDKFKFNVIIQRESEPERERERE